MKVALSGFLALILGLSLVGEAANAQKRAAKKKVVATKKKAAVVPLPERAEPVAVPAPVAPVAAQSQTSTTSAAQAVSEAQPKRWGVLIDLWVEGNVRGMNRASDRAGLKADTGGEINEVMTNNIQIRPSYKITDTASVAAGVDMEHSFGSVAGEDEGKWTTYDAFLQVAHSKFAIAGPVTMKGYLRPYLPTSELSQDPVKGRYAALRAGLTAAVPLGAGLELSYNLEPRYFFQKNESYKTVSKDKVKWSAQENYRLKHWLGLSLDAGKLSAYQNLGLRSRYYHQDSDPSTGATLYTPQQDNIYSETAVGYQIIENFALVGGVYTEQGNDLRKDTLTEGFALYRDEHMLYFVEGVVTF